MRIVSLFLFVFFFSPIKAFSAPQPYQCIEAACGPGLYCVLRLKTECEACDPNTTCTIPGCVEDRQEGICILGAPFCNDGCENDFECVNITFDKCAENNQAVMCDENGENCIIPKPDPCTPVANDYCAPRFVAKCESDIECGSGFTCNTSSRCELIVEFCDSQDDCETTQRCISDADWSRENTPCMGGKDCQSSTDGTYCVPKLYSSWADGGGSISLGGETILSVGKSIPAEEKEESGCSVSRGASAPIWFGLAFTFFAVRRRRRSKG